MKYEKANLTVCFIIEQGMLKMKDVSKGGVSR